jgi:hypothetical protein
VVSLQRENPGIMEIAQKVGAPEAQIIIYEAAHEKDVGNAREREREKREE